MANTARGVFCASATPLDENLNPDHARLVGQCQRLLDDGCHGIALLGSTGEANSFSSAERMAMLEAVVAAGIPAEKVLPGTGLPAYTETAELTRHALSLGVTTVVMLPPFYYKGVTDQGLIDAYSRVIEAVADSRLRIVLYHIPPISQIPITNGVIEGLLKRYPETIAGLKDSSGDLQHMKGLIADFPQLSILAGADPFMLELLGLGGGGCITATSNVVASSLRVIYDHHADVARRDEIEAAQERVVAYRTASTKFPQLPSIKAMVALRTGDDAWLRIRPPFLALTPAQKAELAEMLEAVPA
jgi:4-hydroxy-tetrahydrodipicolinate synthase